MTSSDQFDNGLFVSIDLWYPDCWEIAVTERIDVGLLGYGIYMTGEEVATLFSMYANDQATIANGIEAVAASEHVHSVSEIASGFRRTTVPKPGNTMRELLVTHDGSKQISQPLTSKGFVCTGPIDIRDGREYWKLVTNHSRDEVRKQFEILAEEMSSKINVRSMTQASGQNAVTTLPIDRLTKRQLEVFQLARKNGYYGYPREASAGKLAAELSITTSTLHEHLHKIEAILLGDTEIG